MGILLFFWVVFTAALAIMQGLLLPTLRRTPPGMEANTHDFALHKIGVVAYFLPLLLTPNWIAVAVAFGLRVLLFDVVLNYAAGDKPFHVGRTARTDKMLQWIAAKLRLPVIILSALFRLLALVLLAVVLWINN